MGKRDQHFGTGGAFALRTLRDDATAEKRCQRCGKKTQTLRFICDQELLVCRDCQREVELGMGDER